MAAKIALILACVVGVALCAPPTKSPPSAADSLSQIEAHATELGNTVHQQLSTLVNSDSSKQVQEALRSGADAILQQLSTFSTALQGFAADANSKTAAALEQTRASVQHAADQLKKEHPDVDKQAAALNEQIKSSVSKVSGSVQALAKDLSANLEQTNAKLAPQLQQAVQTLVNTVQQSLSAAAEKASPKH